MKPSIQPMTYNVRNRKEKYNLLGLLKTRREHNIDTYVQIN